MLEKAIRKRLAAQLSALLFVLLGCGDDGDSKPRDQNVAPAGEQTSDGGAAVATDDPSLASLAQGKLQGDVVGGAVRFLKIPFAKPPVGALRWRAPEAADGWSGVRHELGFASPCPQPPSQQAPASTNEDCLYLNVWRPNKSVAQPLPVMVWIHGGGFTTGSAADLVPTSMDALWYDGRPFAERDVVVVTLNYRLGVFGFFAHPELAKEGAPTGNQGLLDQQTALRWVQSNIAAFGGDPKNVTIFGESAGAGSVCMHVVSPGSRGLFHRAVGQSGGCSVPSRTTLSDAQASVVQFAGERGCAGADALTCLRGKPASELVSMAAVDRSMGMDMLRRSFNFGPVVDGAGGFLPEPAAALYARREVAQVPYILGTNSEEARLYFTAAMVPANEEAYRAAITQQYGAFAERVLATYPASRFNGDYRKTMAAIASDSGLICSTLETAIAAVNAGLAVYMYNFNIPWSISREALGASHASEISHVFGTPYNETPENAQVGVAMNAYWASFARSGDPNYPGAPAQWPRFMPDQNGDDLRLQLDPKFEILRSFRKQECALWREIAAQPR